MDHLGLVAGLQVPEDGSVVEEGQVDHVLALLKLRRINPADFSLLVDEFLMANCDCQFGGEISVLSTDVGNVAARLKESLPVAAGFRVWDPHGLFWLIRLVLVRLLHVHGWEEEFGGIRVHRPLDKLDMARHVEAKEVPGGNTL